MIAGVSVKRIQMLAKGRQLRIWEVTFLRSAPIKEKPFQAKTGFLSVAPVQFRQLIVS